MKSRARPGGLRRSYCRSPGSRTRAHDLIAMALRASRCSTLDRIDSGKPVRFPIVRRTRRPMGQREAGSREDAQQVEPYWTGGQGTDPNEQNTQHCPGSGRSRARQDRHSWKKMQASTGMTSSLFAPHAGHVRTDCRIGSGAALMSVSWIAPAAHPAPRPCSRLDSSIIVCESPEQFRSIARECLSRRTSGSRHEAPRIRRFGLSPEIPDQIQQARPTPRDILRVICCTTHPQTSGPRRHGEIEPQGTVDSPASVSLPGTLAVRT